jgi:menaquinone-dependent protoporphyrinogen IX oxidase
MWITKGPTDIKNTYEFTNWDDVNDFSNQLNT